MSFGSDSPGGSPDGIGGDESGIGAGVGMGGYDPSFSGYSVAGYNNTSTNPGLSVAGYSNGLNNLGAITGAQNYGGPEDIGVVQGLMNSLFGINPAAPAYASTPTLGFNNVAKTDAKMGLNAAKGLLDIASVPAPMGLALGLANQYAKSQINAMPATVTSATMMDQMFARAKSQAQDEYDSEQAAANNGNDTQPRSLAELASVAPQVFSLQNSDQEQQQREMLPIIENRNKLFI